MLCKKCNHEIPQGASFCTNCGAPASEPETAEFSRQPQEQDFPETQLLGKDDQSGFDQPAETQQPEKTYSPSDTVPLNEPQRQYYKQPLTPEQNPYVNNAAANYGTAQNVPQQPNGNPYVSHYGEPINGNTQGAAQQPAGSPYVSHYGEPAGGMNARYNEQYHQTYGSQPTRTSPNPAAAAPTAAAPVTPYNAGNGTVGIGAWIGVILLNCVPLVGIIMMFVWAFGSTTKPSLKNYARASLILDAIVLVLSIIAFVICLAVGVNLFSSGNWSWSHTYYY